MSLRTCMTAQGLEAFLEPGLQALRAYSSRVALARDSRPIESIDLDAALAGSHGQDPRWDYGIGLAIDSVPHTAWVEVHPASSAEVKPFLAKLAWLKRRLAFEACRGSKSFHWIATSGVSIDSSKRRLLASAGIRMPRQRLDL
jgi:hypothetical protein